MRNSSIVARAIYSMKLHLWTVFHLFPCDSPCICVTCIIYDVFNHVVLFCFLMVEGTLQICRKTSSFFFVSLVYMFLFFFQIH